MDNLTITVKNEINKQFGNINLFSKHIGISVNEIEDLLDTGVDNYDAKIVIRILHELKIDSELIINVDSVEITKKIIEISSLK